MHHISSLCSNLITYPKELHKYIVLLNLLKVIYSILRKIQHTSNVLSYKKRSLKAKLRSFSFSVLVI